MHTLRSVNIKSINFFGLKLSIQKLALTYFGIKNKLSYSLVKKNRNTFSNKVFKQHLCETYQQLNLESFAETKLAKLKK